jgi:ABC-2 type transport system permease protein
MNSTPAVFAEPGIAASTLKLLRLRLILLFNGFRRAKRRAKVSYVALSLTLLMFIGIALVLSVAFLDFLRSSIAIEHFGDTKALLEGFPSLILSVSAMGILFTSFSVLLQTLYLSGDMDFLMSAPVPIRAVFIAKMVQALLPNFIILCLLTLPTLFGLGISSDYHFPYYPCVVLVLMMITLTAASVASLLVLVVARVFPPRRVAEVLGLVIGLTVLVGSQTMRFANLDFSHVDEQHMSGIAKVILRFNSPWSPLAWAGRGLTGLGKGEWLASMALLAAPVILACIFFGFALATSEQLYHTGWANVQSSHRKSKTKIAARPAAQAEIGNKPNPLTSLLPAPVRAILVKDFRLCRRDLGNLSGLLSPLILGIIYAIGLLRSQGQMPQGRGHAPAGFIQAGNAILGYGDIALALFLGWMLVSNLAGLSFSREGKNYWMLKASPVSTRQMLAAKFLVSYIPGALLCSIYVVTLEILKRASFGSIIAGVASVCMMVAGLTGIYLAFGIRGAKFDWENPAQRQRSIGCLGMLTGMIFMLLCFILFIAPVIVAQVLHLPIAAGRFAGLLLGGIGNALAVIIPLGLVNKRVATLAEE